ncbi:hypothetical protein N864_05850 [Intrasporangium chromatireducens Q5-1]|uniref:Uncharacterized protein n=1 Tax=Intrasporangium chromatireducens Q5-1 TaxID=584657 RepID=W9GMZ1_9MICO|nr:hypothetical protein N864_05850 [Intrasporangium chromatireducens Q5-1]
MTPDGVPPTATAGLLVTGFPEVGPLAKLAYRELNLAGHGSEQQARALGDPARLPRPWDPATCHEADLRAEVWAWLDAVVEWLNREYVWDAAAVIPPCWPAHPHLVHEIAVVADQRRRAGAAFSSDLLEDWHRYTLPGFIDRMRDRLRGHCDEGHQPWPAKGRHARHTDPQARKERAETFAREADRADADTSPRGGRRLSVVDLETGEIREEHADW